VIERGIVRRVAAALLLGVALGVGFGWVVDRGARSAPAHSQSTITRVVSTPTEQTSTTPRATPLEARLGGALSAGIHRVTSGSVEAAVMLDGDGDSVIRPAVAGGRPMRPWSMVKVLTAVSVLYDRAERGLPEGALGHYLTEALTRSDNCAQRELVVQLERARGGLDGARAWLAEMARRGGVGINLRTPPVQTDREGSRCIAPGYEGLPREDAEQPSLLLGTSEWTIDGAVRLMHSLRARAPFTPGVSDRVLALLRGPKRNSREPGAGERLTAPLDWGAGRVFVDPCWHLAYKGGWGGQDRRRYLAGQMGVVDLPQGRWAAFAVVYHPRVQPPDADPGKAGAPPAVETVLLALKRQLQRQFPGSCR
jgi:hypothetical protein